MSDPVACPGCQGRGQNFVFWDGEHSSGSGYRDCMRCGGTGSISAEHAARIERGKVMREERKARGETMLAAATRMGIPPADLSAIEQGRRDP